MCKTDGCILFTSQFDPLITVQNITTIGQDLSYTPRIFMGDAYKLFVDDYILTSYASSSGIYYNASFENLPYLGSALYIAYKSSVVSLNNSFSNHKLAQNGSVFNLLSVQTFSEKSSIFTSNSGYQGGVVCSYQGSQLVFRNSAFYSNEGKYGGGVNIIAPANATFYNLTVNQSIAYQQGGFLSYQSQLDYQNYVNALYLKQDKTRRLSQQTYTELTSQLIAMPYSFILLNPSQDRALIPTTQQDDQHPRFSNKSNPISNVFFGIRDIIQSSFQKQTNLTKQVSQEQFQTYEENDKIQEDDEQRTEKTENFLRENNAEISQEKFNSSHNEPTQLPRVLDSTWTPLLAFYDGALILNTQSFNHGGFLSTEATANVILNGSIISNNTISNNSVGGLIGFVNSVNLTIINSQFGFCRGSLVYVVKSSHLIFKNNSVKYFKQPSSTDLNVVPYEVFANTTEASLFSGQVIYGNQVDRIELENNLYENIFYSQATAISFASTINNFSQKNEILRHVHAVKSIALQIQEVQTATIQNITVESCSSVNGSLFQISKLYQNVVIQDIVITNLTAFAGFGGVLSSQKYGSDNITSLVGIILRNVSIIGFKGNNSGGLFYVNSYLTSLFIQNIMIQDFTPNTNRGQILYASNSNLYRGYSSITFQDIQFDCYQEDWNNKGKYSAQPELFYSLGFNIYLKNLRIQNCQNLSISAFATIKTAEYIESTNVTFYQLSSTGAGVFTLSNVSNVLIRNTTFDKIQAQSSGMVSTQNLVQNINLTNLTVQNIEVLNGTGGLLNTADLRIYQSALSIQKYSLISLQIQNVTVKGGGGLFYISNPFISLFSTQGVLARNISADLGGVFYIQEMRNQILLSSLDGFNSTDAYQTLLAGNSYSEISSSGNGTFLYSTAKNVSIKIAGLKVKCELLVQNNLQYLFDQANVSRPVMYIENNLNQLILQRSDFQNCYKSLRGGIVTLVSSSIIDQSSNYANNFGRQGGVFYFYNSSFLIQGSKFQNNNADEGGIMLGDLQTSGKLIDLSVENCRALSKGGFMSVVFTSNLNSPVLSIILSGRQFKISNITSNQGGLIFSNSKYMNVSIEDSIQIFNISATSKGGIAYIEDISQLRIQDSLIVQFTAPVGGFIYSLSINLNLLINQSLLQCLTQDLYAIDYVKDQQQQIPFYLENSQSIIFDSMNLTLCASDFQGSNFQVKNSLLQFLNSQAYSNKALDGGLFRLYEANLTVRNSTFTNNTAEQGGIFFLSQNSYTIIEDSQFANNKASKTAGVMVISSGSYSQIEGSLFLQNESEEDSSILNVLGSSSSQNVTLSNSIFRRNKAKRNALKFIYSSASIYNCTFEDNEASEQSENILIAFADFTLSNSTLIKSKDRQWSLISNSESKSLQGSFVQILLNANLLITGSSFTNGFALQGGALYLQGESSVIIQSSKFEGNYASATGGSIYGANFGELTVRDCYFGDNQAALSLGDDIYSVGDSSVLKISNTSIQNPNGTQAIYASQIQLSVDQSQIQGRGLGVYIQNGAAIQCINCKGLSIKEVEFSELTGIVGAAIYIEVDDLMKLSRLQYDIQNSNFTNCSSLMGGALSLSNINSMKIQNSKFLGNTADLSLLETKSLKSQQKMKWQGSGGAVYYSCSDTIAPCNLTLDNVVNFTNNSADYYGGAIYWNDDEPNLDQQTTFLNNSAFYYGDDIASFGQQVIQINYDLYSLYLNSSNASLTSSLRELQQSQGVNAMSLEKIKSGGLLDPIYLAVIDKYGQIVGSTVSSKVLVYVNGTYNNDASANTFQPVIEGVNEFLTERGVFEIEKIVFDATPGNQYQLIIQVDSLDASKLPNQQFMKANGLSSMDFKIQISLRECEIGEQYTIAGKCQKCVNSFLLVQQTSPGECIACPTDRAKCNGGTSLLPFPGYWRFSNITSKIYQCLNSASCLGLESDDQSFETQCSESYQGVLCADCQDNYSRSGSFSCAKCPDRMRNIFRLGFIALGIILLLIFMVYSTISGAQNKNNLTGIYLKIMLNHFQLLMMVSVFDINWSKEIEQFIKSSDGISTVYTQVFSLDCLINQEKGNLYNSSKDTEEKLRIYYIKLILLALLPVLLIVGCVICCALFNYYFKKASTHWRQGLSLLTISSIVACLFLAHPSIVQFMFQNFRCYSIEGEGRLLKDLEIVCWSSWHNFFSFSTALPSIAIWGLGIPLFALMQIFKNRSKLDDSYVRQSYGFLYRGFKKQYFYWEVVIMLRKIIIIALAVFIRNVGLITQTMLVIVVLFIFLCLNSQLKPYVKDKLNQLENLSLLSSLVTFYIAIFFLLDKSQRVSASSDSDDYLISMTNLMTEIFYIIIIASNCIFFIYWLKSIYEQIKVLVREKLPRVYTCCLFTNKDKQSLELKTHTYQIMNLDHLEQFHNILNKVRSLQERGELKLNNKNMKEFEHYFSHSQLLAFVYKSNNKDVENTKNSNKFDQDISLLKQPKKKQETKQKKGTRANNPQDNSTKVDDQGISQQNQSGQLKQFKVIA